MRDEPDFFRDYGIIPYDMPPPAAGTIRCFLSWGHVIGQYVFSVIMLGFGLGIGILFAFTLPSPLNVLASATAFAGFGFLIYIATRNDYVWVELDEDVLRAKHLYMRWIIERPIEEIEDLLTLVFQIRSLEAEIVEAWLGRVRGIEIRFRDQRTPIRISRTDPAMRNAKELIEAVIYQMARKGPVDAEFIDFQGKPMIRRIYWK